MDGWGGGGEGMEARLPGVWPEHLGDGCATSLGGED